MMMNRNKRGIAVDLSTRRARSAPTARHCGRGNRELRKGTMERLAWATRHARDQSGIVYCEVSGFGRSGPYAERGGFDLIAQGISGLMSITGEGPARPPVKCGAPVTDITAGILAAMGVLAAYVHRLKTGRTASASTPRCSRPAFCIPTGSPRSRWPPASRRGRSAPHTR